MAQSGAGGYSNHSSINIKIHYNRFHFPDAGNHDFLLCNKTAIHYYRRCIDEPLDVCKWYIWRNGQSVTNISKWRKDKQYWVTMNKTGWKIGPRLKNGEYVCRRDVYDLVYIQFYTLLYKYTIIYIFFSWK